MPKPPRFTIENHKPKIPDRQSAIRNPQSAVAGARQRAA